MARLLQRMGAANDAAFMPFSRAIKTCLERKRSFFEKRSKKLLIAMARRRSEPSASSN
jgi:hypothetical protein